jgi:uncharacterized protein YgiM (DUF1202 family)
MLKSHWLVLGACACAVLGGCKTTEGGGGLLGDVGRKVLLDEASRRGAGSVGAVTNTAAQAASIGAAEGMCGDTGSVFCRNLTGTLAASFTAEFIERMTQADLQKAAEARQKSIETGQPQVWENSESGASGTVETKVAEPRPPAPTAITVEEPVEMSAPIMDAVGEPYVVTASGGVNVRRGPGTEFPVVMQMASGERFNAIAKVQDDNWYLVGKGAVGKGYVSGALIATAPVQLDEAPPPQAEEPTREVEVAIAAECFTTTQSVTLADGTSENATVTSCRTPNGWVQV